MTEQVAGQNKEYLEKRAGCLIIRCYLSQLIKFVCLPVWSSYPVKYQTSAAVKGMKVSFSISKLFQELIILGEMNKQGISRSHASTD